MSEISKSTNINSIEEFRACYEQELKEILEELSNNGVENIDGVEEVVKLFFDEYYQYLSVELAPYIGVEEEEQFTIYSLTEMEEFLKKFKNVLSSQDYEKLYQDNRREMEDVKKIIKYNGSFKNWYLEKNMSKLNKMILSLETPSLFIGSIIYNGHLKNVEELLKKYQIYSINITRLESDKEQKFYEIKKIMSAFSYEIPKDLLEKIHPYLLEILYNNLYLNTTDMHLLFYGYAKLYGIGKCQKITKEELNSYLGIPISFGNFWKVEIIKQFLSKLKNDSYLMGFYLNYLFQKSTFEELEYLYNLINSKLKIKLLSKPWETFLKFWDEIHIENKDKSRKMHDFCRAFNGSLNEELRLKSGNIYGNYGGYYGFKQTDNNVIKKLKSDYIDLLDGIKEYRIETAMKLFGLTREEAVALSIDELEQKYNDFREEIHREAEQALKKIETISKIESEKFIVPIREKEEEIVEVDSAIRNTKEEMEEIIQEIREFADKSLDVKEPISACINSSDYELHLYILNKLIKKYRPLIEPKITELAEKSKQTALDAYKKMDIITPFGLNISSQDRLPSIGPSITRKLEP